MPSDTRNEVRIIGGAWRGRKLRFPSGVPGLRPTPDRVRETLFNWLREDVAGARALDLYAGSGALGFEALSRGAREVLFVDRDVRVCRHLVESLARFGSRAGVVRCTDAQALLRAGGEPFDLIFLDPPFEADALPALLKLIDAGGWLRPDGLVYLEGPESQGAPSLPEGWTLHRSRRAGEVGYHLARAASARDAAARGPKAEES
jgi:16S rRNA (guanine966-N2)-methyltransferase